MSVSCFLQNYLLDPLKMIISKLSPIKIDRIKKTSGNRIFYTPNFSH